MVMGYEWAAQYDYIVNFDSGTPTSQLASCLVPECLPLVVVSLFLVIICIIDLIGRLFVAAALLLDVLRPTGD